VEDAGNISVRNRGWERESIDDGNKSRVVSMPDCSISRPGNPMHTISLYRVEALEIHKVEKEERTKEEESKHWSLCTRVQYMGCAVQCDTGCTAGCRHFRRRIDQNMIACFSESRPFVSAKNT
jgi:hypothetical protein